MIPVVLKKRRKRTPLWLHGAVMCLVTVTLPPTATHAGDFDVPLYGARMRHHNFEAVKSGETFQFRTDADWNPNAGRSSIEASGNELTLCCRDGSVGVMWVAGQEDRKRYKKLAWHWKATQFPRHKNGHVEFSDQAAQILVVYGHEKGAFPAVNYAWIEKAPGGKLPQSLIGYRPYIQQRKSYLDVKVEIQRVGTEEGWIEECVELDGRLVAGIILLADSNNSHSDSVASFRNVKLID